MGKSRNGHPVTDVLEASPTVCNMTNLNVKAVAVDIILFIEHFLRYIYQ